MSQLTIQRIDLDDLKLHPKDFWKKIYTDSISPRPNCDLCHKSIDQPREWYSFTCQCPKYYHKQCVYDQLSNLMCPECKESKEFYTFNKFPCKFVTRERYLEIYNRSIQNLDPQRQLKIYEYLFQAIPAFVPPLLDLYTYLEPHAPSKTMNFIKENLSHFLIESYDPAIIVKHNEDGKSTDIQYDCERINYMDQKVFVDINSFRKKFKEFCYDMVGEDFPWSDTVQLVGGTVHKCLESRIKIENIPEYCDVDIFVISPDLKILTKEFKKVVKYFKDRFGEDVYWLVRRNIVNLYVPGYNRSIQIIMFRNTLENIIHQFDFSHIQFAFNGSKIMSSLPGLKYASLLISTHNGYYDVTFPKRYFKAKDLNLCLALPMDKVLYLQIPKVQSIDYWYPTYTDDLERIQTQLKNIFRVHKKYITKTTPFKIFYKKVPTEFNNDRLNGRNVGGIGGGDDGDLVSYEDNEMIFPVYSG